MPKVSVIIPAYNSEKYIRETLDSVLKQTYQDFEVVIVDDGSNDGTASIISGYVKQCPEKVRYFYQENAGVAAARNRAITLAKGSYIALLDHDDLWQPDKLMAQIERFNADPDLAMVYTGFTEFGYKANPHDAQLYEGSIFKRLIEKRFIDSSSVMINTAVLNKVGMFDEDRRLAGADDYDMWLRIASKYRIGCVDRKLALWRSSREGYTYSMREKLLEAYLLVMKKNETLIKQAGRDAESAARRAISAYYFSDGWLYFDEGNNKKAKERFWKALVCDPFNLGSLLYLFLTFIPYGVIKRLKSVVKGVEAHLASGASGRKQ